MVVQFFIENHCLRVSLLYIHALIDFVLLNRDISGSSILLVNVYLPSESVSSCFSEYLNTLGELEGFIESQQCDYTLIAGDFNVDFVRGGPLASLLVDFITDQNFVVCDLSYQESVNFTYERDDGLVRSWISLLCVHSRFPHWSLISIP